MIRGSDPVLLDQPGLACPKPTQLLDHLALRWQPQTCGGFVAVRHGFTHMVQCRVVHARHRCLLGVGLLQVFDDGLGRPVQAVQIQPIDAHTF